MTSAVWRIGGRPWRIGGRPVAPSDRGPVTVRSGRTVVVVGTPARRTDPERPPLLGPLVIGALAIIGALAVLRLVIGALTGLLFLTVLVAVVVLVVRAALRR